LYDGTKASVDQAESKIEVRVEASPAIRQYEIILPANGMPGRVLLLGAALDQLDDAGYKVHKKGWWMSLDKRTLHVLFLSDNFTLNVLKQ
jgi:hypothetical protein